MGRPRADHQRTLEGILYVLRTGCRWQDLPPEYGAPVTVWRRLRAWEVAGVWEQVWRAVLSSLDAQANWSGRRRFWTVPSCLQKRGRWGRSDPQGQRHQMDAAHRWQRPASGLCGRQRAESRSDAGCAYSGNGACGRRSGQTQNAPCPILVADRAYDSGAFRQQLRALGALGICIPPRQRPKTWKPKRGRPVT